MSGLLCLKWNNHSPAFLKQLSKLRVQEHYCDATIVCHNKYYSVHKFVLSTCSEYFEEIFEKTQCKHPFIIVKDIQSSELEALLNYMYNGEVNVLQELLPGLIRAAECLKVKGLAVPEDEVNEGQTAAPRKSKREKRNVHSNSPSSKKLRELDENTSEPIKNLQNFRGTVNELKEEKSSTYSISNKDDLQNGVTNSNLQSEVQESLQNVKLEPGVNSEGYEEENHIENLNDYCYRGQSNPKEENLPLSEDISSFVELGLSQQHPLEQPQCSSWEGLIATDEGGESNTNLEGLQDEIGPVELLQSSLILKDYLLNPEDFSKNSGETSVRSKNGKATDSSTLLQCKFCPYKSMFAANLRRHFFHRHSEDKPFKCKICPYRSAQKGHVSQHMRTHTGEKPFKCPVCPFKAAQKNNMKRHIKTHDKESTNFNFPLDFIVQ